MSVFRLLVVELSSSDEGRRFDSAKKLFRRAQDEEEDDFLLVSMLPGPGPGPGRQKPLSRCVFVDSYQDDTTFFPIRC